MVPEHTSTKTKTKTRRGASFSAVLVRSAVGSRAQQGCAALLRGQQRLHAAARSGLEEAAEAEAPRAAAVH